MLLGLTPRDHRKQSQKVDHHGRGRAFIKRARLMSALPLIAERKRTLRRGRVGPKHLYGVVGVKFSLWAISLFGRAATSPRPDLPFARLLRGAAVKGGRRPSRSDLPLTAASTAADLSDRGGPRLATETIPKGARHRARRSRATNLYSAGPRESQP
jgi:hypothetical protein